MKIYTIQDLKDGKVAVINDGTLEELQKVLKLAFPNADNIPVGSDMYYYSSFLRTIGSRCGNINLPTQSVKNFLKWSPQYGEEIEVCERSTDIWHKHKFINYHPNNNRIITSFRENICSWDKLIRFKKPVITELSLRDIADKFNLEVSQIRIKD